MAPIYFEIFSSFFAWTMYYYLIRLLTSKKPSEFSIRILTFTHGLITAVLGTNQCFEGDEYPILKPLEPTDQLQRLILTISVGYFYVDLIWCLCNKTETMLMLTHHICSCLALTRMIYRGVSGGQACCSLGFLELTNPLLQTRWFIRTCGYHKTPLFFAVEVTFIITYFVVRIVLGSVYLGLVLYQKDNPLEYMLIAFSMYVISWLFFFNIIIYLKNKYHRKPSRSSTISKAVIAKLSENEIHEDISMDKGINS